MLGRIGIDIYPKNPNIVYVCIENANKPGMSDEDRLKELLGDKSSRGMIDGEVYRSEDAGLTWTKVSPDKQSIGGSPGYYYGQVRVDPNNDQVVHVLSAASWGTTDGGTTWQRRPLRFGGDDHALWIDPEDSNHMLLGYDHGMGITYDGGENWYHPDFLPLAQFYAVGLDMSYPYNVAGGLQDNGSALGPSTKRGGGPIRLEDWQRVGGGDGNIQYCTITAFDESPLVEGLLWVGTDDGNVWVTQDGGKNWTLLNDSIPGNPGYWVSRVTASSHDPGTAYVSCTGYRRDDFRPFLYKTTDYGKTWASLAANLPEEPINVIREHPKNPNLLFVGTEFAVHISIDGGKNWVSMKNNMPTQPVHDLKIHPRENDLVVATHGRGIFVADISALSELTAGTLAEEVHLFDIESKVRYVNNDRRFSSSSNFSGESEPNGIVVYYYLKEAPEGDVKVTVFRGNLLINEVKGSKEPGINKVVWTMTKRRERTEEEKKQMRERMERFRAFGFRGRFDINYEHTPALEGEYRFVLTVGGKTYTKKASILKDHWFDR